MHGRQLEYPSAPEPAHWRDSRAYLHGLDLFNHGYYWEAHETWEGLWHACARRGPTADFLRGLIKLAAAGVKVREGTPAGVVSHARRAAAIFRAAAQRLGGENARCFGLRLGDLLAHARAVEALAPATVGDRHAGVRVVFDFVLAPQSAAGEPRV
jgi:predicted metal-dependent hydrolase